MKVFSVANGPLNLSSIPSGGGSYQRSDLPNARLGFVYEFRLRVTESSTAFAIDFDVSEGAGQNAWEFGFEEDRIVQFTNSGTVTKKLIDTTQFHTYRLEVDNAATLYRFYIDDFLEFTGSSWTNSDSTIPVLRGTDSKW